MLTILAKLRNHFYPPEMVDRMTIFRNQEIQIEGWFKGEFLYVLQKLKDQNEIDDFRREVKHSGGVTDLFIESGGASHWVELKHWLIGEQKGQLYRPGFYFGQVKSNGIIGDVRKLCGIENASHRWLLILCTENPHDAEWEEGILKFREKFQSYHLSPLTLPHEFPASFFLGLLKVSTIESQ